MSGCNISDSLISACNLFINPANAQSTKTSLNDNQSVPEYRPGEVVVKFKSQVIVQPKAIYTNFYSINSIFAKYDVQNIQKFFRGIPKALKHESRIRRGPLPDLSNVYKLKVLTGINIGIIIDELKNDPNVEYAEPNYISRPDETIPNDTYYSQQWYLPKIEAPLAWDIERGNPNITIAVIDRGVDYTHPDIADRIWINEGEIPNNGIDDDGNGYVDDIRGWNFDQDNNDPMDNIADPHGTKVAGIIGAITNNNFGVSGINWSSKIMAIKGTGPLAEAIVYAADNGAHIINMSLGHADTQLLVDSINYAYNMGVILIASAGNDLSSTPHYPAAYEQVIAVGATNRNDERACWQHFMASTRLDACYQYGSNFAYWVDLVAPNGLYTLTVNNGYDDLGGTSAAAPVVTGVASLILSNRPYLTNDEIRQILINSADDIGDPGWDIYSSYGRVNAYRALTESDPSYYPVAKIISPIKNECFRTVIEIHGFAESPFFSHYTLEWGLGEDPISWSTSNVILASNGTLPVSNGLLGLLHANFNDYLTIRLTTFDRFTYSSFSTVTVHADNTLKNGWPVSTDGQILSSSVALADIDGDGVSEVLVGSSKGGTYGWEGDGTLIKSWPSGEILFSSPSAGDLDKDGKLEILFGSKDNHMYAYKLNGDPVINWPFLAEDDVHSSAGLEDIDHDTNLEVAFGSFGEKFYLLDVSATLLNGWPVTSDAPIRSSPALGDLNNDFASDIVFANFYNLFAYEKAGNPLNGWPLSSEHWILNSPVLADLNQDGHLDIVAQLRSSGDCLHGNNLYVLKNDGTPMPGWPIALGSCVNNSSPAIADIDGDGFLDIAIGTNYGTLAVISKDGSSLAGWPVALEENCSIDSCIFSSPAVGDINGDMKLEIVIGSGNNKLYAFDQLGNILPGWPKVTGKPIFSAPAIGDIDGNGKIDIVAASYDGKVYAWETGGLYNPEYLPWPQFQHDARRTGNYNADTIPPIIIHVPVLSANNATNIPIPARITDNIAVQMAKIYYKNRTSATYEFVQMSNVSGDIWEGTIPASAVTTDGVEYYIVAHDSSINPKIDPLGAPETNVYTITVDISNDHTPPIITHEPVNNATEGSSILITAGVNDDLSGVAEVKLIYYKSYESQKEIIMENKGNNFFAASIPGQDVVPSSLYYYIFAKDNNGNEAKTTTYLVNVNKFSYPRHGCGCYMFGSRRR